MRELLTDRESAKILGIKINQLYDTVDFFDKYDDDPWDLVEGEHSEFVQSTGDYQERRFTEEGVEAIAKYLEGDREGVIARRQPAVTPHCADGAVFNCQKLCRL